jgi:hypothetical protein
MNESLKRLNQIQIAIYADFGTCSELNWCSESCEQQYLLMTLVDHLSAAQGRGEASIDLFAPYSTFVRGSEAAKPAK